MPKYVYRCKDCKKTFKDEKKIDERYDTNCPYCGLEQTGEENLEIIPQLSNFIIK